MDVASFDEIAADFDVHVRTIVWAAVATLDHSGRPRVRVLHPIWEGMMWSGGPEDPNFGLLKLTARRIEVQDLTERKPSRVRRAAP